MQPVDYLPSCLAEVLFWIYYNQTLIAGFAALGVGWHTVSEIKRQIAVSENAVVEERKRQLRIDRAYLSQSLSLITQYAIECLQVLTVQLREHVEDKATLTQTGFAMPVYPEKAFSSLRQVALNEDGDTFTFLATLVSFAQIQHARLASIAHDASTNSAQANVLQHKANLYGPIRDAIELEAWAASLFQYARFRASAPTQFPEKEWAKSRLEMHHCFYTTELSD
jgi:hypothetical protein